MTNATMHRQHINLRQERQFTNAVSWGLSFVWLSMLYAFIATFNKKWLFAAFLTMFFNAITAAYEVALDKQIEDERNGRIDSSTWQ